MDIQFQYLNHTELYFHSISLKLHRFNNAAANFSGDLQNAIHPTFSSIHIPCTSFTLTLTIGKITYISFSGASIRITRTRGFYGFSTKPTFRPLLTPPPSGLRKPAKVLRATPNFYRLENNLQLHRDSDKHYVLTHSHFLYANNVIMDCRPCVWVCVCVLAEGSSTF